MKITQKDINELKNYNPPFEAIMSLAQQLNIENSQFFKENEANEIDETLMDHSWDDDFFKFGRKEDLLLKIPKIGEKFICVNCGKEETQTKYVLQKYCTIKCKNEHTQKDYGTFICQWCGKEEPRRNNRDVKYCCKDCVSSAQRNRNEKRGIERAFKVDEKIREEIIDQKKHGVKNFTLARRYKMTEHLVRMIVKYGGKDGDKRAS